jgi:hypothetical protein
MDGFLESKKHVLPDEPNRILVHDAGDIAHKVRQDRQTWHARYPLIVEEPGAEIHLFRIGSRTPSSLDLTPQRIRIVTMRLPWTHERLSSRVRLIP